MMTSHNMLTGEHIGKRQGITPEPQYYNDE